MCACTQRHRPRVECLTSRLSAAFALDLRNASIDSFHRRIKRISSQPIAQDQTIVNSMLNTRHVGGTPSCAAPAGLRHAHFPPRLARNEPRPNPTTTSQPTQTHPIPTNPRLVHGGPSIPTKDKLLTIRVHHATASGGAAGKLRSLDVFLDAWMVVNNRTWSDLGLVGNDVWGGSVQTEVTESL